MPSIICDALCNLVPFAQFKKRERHPWRSNFTKSNTPPWVFSRFLNCTNDIKSRKTSHLVSVNLNHIIFLLVFPVLCQLLVWSEILIISFIIQNITIQMMQMNIILYRHVNGLYNVSKTFRGRFTESFYATNEFVTFLNFFDQHEN